MENLYIPMKCRAVITISGPDAAKFLQGITTNDIYKADANNAIYSLLLTPQGKFIYDFFIVKQGDNYLLDCNNKNKDEIIKKFNFYKLRADVTISDLSDELEVVALIGDAAFLDTKNTKAGQRLNFDNLIAYVDPRSAKLYTRLVIKKSDTYKTLLANGFSEGATDLYKKLRIDNQIPSGDFDLVANDSYPLQFGLDELNAIDFNKGCYVGQEVTNRTKRLGSSKKSLQKISKADYDFPGAFENIIKDGKIVGTMLSSLGDAGLALMRKRD